MITGMSVNTERKAPVLIRRITNSHKRMPAIGGSDGQFFVSSNKHNLAAERPWVEADPFDALVVTDAMGSESSDATGEIGAFNASANLIRRASPLPQPFEVIASVPIGIWEGEVLDVNWDERRFTARLTPLKGAITEMSGDISFDELNDEDMPLLVVGAVFYIEQFRRLVRRQISHSQQVRFRRLPAWDENTLARLDEAIAQLEGIEENI